MYARLRNPVIQSMLSDCSCSNVVGARAEPKKSKRGRFSIVGVAQPLCRTADVLFPSSLSLSLPTDELLT